MNSCACWLLLATLLLGFLPTHALAATMGSTSYAISEGEIGEGAGGVEMSAAGGGATVSIGEPFVGPTSAAPRAAQLGYVASIPGAITLAVDSLVVDFASIPTSGASAADETLVTVSTVGPGWTLHLAQDHDLDHATGPYTIDPVTGTVAAPVPWTEGTTSGLGFTVQGASADPVWGTPVAPNYAAVPSSPSAVHVRSGYQSSPDEIELGFRVAVPMLQPAGSYSNALTVTAVPSP